LFGANGILVCRFISIGFLPLAKTQRRKVTLMCLL
jgi:hypothetical protein